MYTDDTKVEVSCPGRQGGLLGLGQGEKEASEVWEECVQSILYPCIEVAFYDPV